MCSFKCVFIVNYKFSFDRSYANCMSLIYLVYVSVLLLHRNAHIANKRKLFIIAKYIMNPIIKEKSIRNNRTSK